MKSILLLAILLGSTSLNAQVSNRIKKLVGTWEFKKGSGFETWEIIEEEVVGYEYRINKIGDTLKVEEMHIKTVGNHLVYSIGDHHSLNDSIKLHEKMNFISNNKKMNFLNIDSNTPYSISYSFGFLSKNRLKIKIKNGQADKPAKLKLIRVH